MCRQPPFTLSVSADSASDEKALLHTAARQGDVRTLLSLIKSGATTIINEQATSVKWTALHTAAAFNSPFAVSALLRHGADPNVRDIDGDTPLITAASLGHTEVVQQLVAKADLMQVSPRGETALHVAAEAGFGDVASILIARGGIRLVNTRNRSGSTASDLARGKPEILEMITSLKELKETWI